MLKFEWLLNLITLYINKLQKKYDQRTLLVIFGFIILFLFADTLLPMFWHFLVLIWHITEAFIEHGLEELFGIKHWHADFITFWICTAIASFIGWRVGIKCYHCTKNTCRTCKDHWQRKPKGVRHAIVVMVAAVLVVFNM